MKTTIPTYGPNAAAWSAEAEGVAARLEHVDGDPEGVYRLYLERDGMRVELCPSKGLSIRDTRAGDREFFWDSPLPNLPDPVTIDLEGAMLVRGKPVLGAAWVGWISMPYSISSTGWITRLQ